MKIEDLELRMLIDEGDDGQGVNSINKRLKF